MEGEHLLTVPRVGERTTLTSSAVGLHGPEPVLGAADSDRRLHLRRPFCTVRGEEVGQPAICSPASWSRLSLSLSLSLSLDVLVWSRALWSRGAAGVLGLSSSATGLRLQRPPPHLAAGGGPPSLSRSAAERGREGGRELMVVFRWGSSL